MCCNSGNVCQEIIICTNGAQGDCAEISEEWKFILYHLIKAACHEIEGKELFLFQVTNYSLFFELVNLNEHRMLDDYFSIDPYSFLDEHPVN